MFPTEAQEWHELGGDTLQIYSTLTPQTPRQPQLPETAALSPTPAPVPPPSLPPSLQRTGLNGILNPPPRPSLAVPANASGSRRVSTPLSCCQPGQGACEASGLQTAWCPTGGGDAGTEVPGTSSASTALGLLSVSCQHVSAAAAVPNSSETPRCRRTGLKYQPVPERAGKDSVTRRA